MPELPEVEGVVESLRPYIVGKTIEKIHVSDQLVTSHEAGKQAIIKGLAPAAFSEAVQGFQIKQLTRRSKYMFFELEYDGQHAWMVGHLGMTGAWFPVNSLDDITEAKFRNHIHVIFTLDDGSTLVYSDIRRFGELRFLHELHDHPPLLAMASEPFTEEGLAHYLEMAELPKYKNKPIKAFIMDGHVISGCGNIYATEALFRMKIHPNRQVGRISKKRKIELYQAIVDVLKESIERGGSSISDYRNVNGGAGNMQHFLKMYGKKQCPTCGTQTKQMVIGGRTSTYCPVCQK